MASIKNTIKKNNISKAQKNLKTKSLRGSQSKNRPKIEQSKKKRNTQKASKKTLKKSGGSPGVISNALSGVMKGAISLKNKASRSVGKMTDVVKKGASNALNAKAVANRLLELNAIWGYLPNNSEVLGTNKYNLKGKRFTKNIYENMKANLLALACIDHATFLRMNMINPDDVADLVRTHEHLNTRNQTIPTRNAKMQRSLIAPLGGEEVRCEQQKLNNNKTKQYLDTFNGLREIINTKETVLTEKTDDVKLEKGDDKYKKIMIGNANGDELDTLLKAYAYGNDNTNVGKSFGKQELPKDNCGSTVITGSM